MAQPAIPQPRRVIPTQRAWYNPRTFAAFDFVPFRWYMGATIWWNAAMSMQMIVRGYLAYSLTGNFSALGIVGLGSAVPMLLVSPLGGVVADRTSRRLVLQLGQSFSCVLAVAMATLLLLDILVFWHLIAASVAQGLMMAMVMPSRQSYLPEVVGLRRLMNAIPLQTAGMNLMQILGPAVGGPLIDILGPGYVYVIMTVIYMMSVVMLFPVRSLSPEEMAASRTRGMGAARAGPLGGRRRGALGELKAGFQYALRDRTILVILSFSFLGSLLGMPIRMLLPGYVAEVYGDSGTTLGIMQMGMGLGALSGALWLASVGMRQRRGLLFAGSAVLMGIFMLAFSATGSQVLGWLALMMVGVGSAGRQTLSQILAQEYVEEDYRGRVMSLYQMQFSLMSFGTFFVALYMDWVGPQFAIGSLGITLIAATGLYLLMVPRFRRLS